jgi:DUF4097 and DUF4098 domain-containing protein YvlB
MHASTLCTLRALCILRTVRTLRPFIYRKYNARVWIVLAAAAWLLSFAPGLGAADVSDRHTQTVALPAGKPLSIEVTIGAVRIDGWDRTDAEIIVERRAPATAQLTRLPLLIDDTPDRVSVRAVQTNNTTDPAFRADVTVRVPRGAVIDRVQVLEGRITLEGLSGRVTADIRRGPIDGRSLSGTLRLEAGIGSVTLTDTRLSENGLLRLRTFNGDVRLSLAQRPADARIMALALNGHVKSDIPLNTRNTWGPRWSETTLGKGEPVISLDVVTGTVEIKSP